jgi:hypothetical protein
VSEDGSRVFFSDAETSDIYMREPQANPAVTIPVSQGPAFWRAATSNGDYVYYTEGPDLYRFNVNGFLNSPEPEPQALAEAREQLTSGAEGLFGVLGISDDSGAYVYFAAPGDLAENENAHGEKAVTGAPNLYMWHEGSPGPTFIATLKTANSPGGASDEPDWTTAVVAREGPAGHEKSSRVSRDGRILLFSSLARLTPYDNAGAAEFYRYDAGQPLSPSNPQCITCNPAGTPASGGPHLTTSQSGVTAQPQTRDPFLTHNFSDSGGRLFFETAEALVPGDANLTQDVYEWEADGEGSCLGEAQDGGCLYLISTGQSTEPAYFGDASADGANAFFFTRQPLVGQDIDSNVDLYDVRIQGGIPAQNPSPAPAPCGEEATCRGASSSTPSEFGTPLSATFSGSGNLAPVVPAATGVHKHKTAAQIRAERRAKALKACRSRRQPKAKRRRCEAAARKRYGSRTARSHTSSRRVIANEHA